MTRYQLRYSPQVADDLATLATEDAALARAALAACGDLSSGHSTGMLLGKSGLARLRFDAPGILPPRCRIVYRVAADKDTALEIIAITRGNRREP